MENFADRTIGELIESYEIFVDTLKEEYDVLLNIIDIIFSSCSIMSKIEDINCDRNLITFEAFDCFFEYQIYKIMEKYRYYDKIRNQFKIIRGIYYGLRHDDPKINDYSYLYERCRCLIYLRFEQGNEVIIIAIDEKNYLIKVEDKYKQDMLNLLRRRLDN